MDTITGMYRHHKGVVRTVLLRYEADYDTVDELMQDVFLAAIVSNEHWKNRAAPAAWLVGIAHNIGRNHVRCAARRVDMVSEAEFLGGDVESYADTLNASRPIDDPALVVEAQDSLNAGYGAMPEQMRRCVQLRQEGYSNPAIASALATTESVVRSQISQSARYFNNRLNN